MKKVLLIGSLALAFMVVGCSKKNTVEIDNAATQGSSTATTQDSTSPKSVVAGANSESSGGSGYGNSGGGASGSGKGNSGNGGSGTSGYNGGGGSSDNLKSVYFGFDKFIVEGSANIDAIRSNAAQINNSGAYEIRVEGNTDEWGSDEYNYALALKRAASVKDALVANNVPESKIRLVSYGESKPKCLEKTKECWRENRRADFVLVK